MVFGVSVEVLIEIYGIILTGVYYYFRPQLFRSTTEDSKNRGSNVQLLLPRPKMTTDQKHHLAPSRPQKRRKFSEPDIYRQLEITSLTTQNLLSEILKECQNSRPSIEEKYKTINTSTDFESSLNDTFSSSNSIEGKWHTEDRFSRLISDAPLTKE